MRAASSKVGDRGAAAVEFALVLPLLLILIFGIIDFGRMLNAKITLTEAAREGARAAALVGTDAGADRARAAATGYTLNDPDVDECPTSPGADDNATVTVTYNFQFVTPISLLFGANGDGIVKLSATGVMPCLG
jgi:Flp pilus assembly protein TadG